LSEGRYIYKQPRIGSGGARLGAGGVGEAEVAVVDIVVLMLCAPLVRAALAPAVLKRAAPVSRAGVAVNPELLARQVCGTLAGLQAAGDTVLVAGAALVLHVAPAGLDAGETPLQYGVGALGRARVSLACPCSDSIMRGKRAQGGGMNMRVCSRHTHSGSMKAAA
jgi:hypothetical protein